LGGQGSSACPDPCRMQANNSQQLCDNVAFNQINKCTICFYKSDVKSNFERHLLRVHDIELKDIEAEVAGGLATFKHVISDYGLDQKRECSRCYKTLDSQKALKNHRVSCERLFREAMMTDSTLVPCPNCKVIFEEKKLNRHIPICREEKKMCCLICSFKCASIGKMQEHTIYQHNLICKPVIGEPDFGQALNRAPYTLERAIGCELPIKGKKNKLLTKRETPICPDCKKTFSKLKHLHQHKKTIGRCLGKQAGLFLF